MRLGTAAKCKNFALRKGRKCAGARVGRVGCAMLGGMHGQRRIRARLPVPCDVLHDISGQRRMGLGKWAGCDVDQVLAALATRQGGVIGRSQLDALEVGSRRDRAPAQAWSHAHGLPRRLRPRPRGAHPARPPGRGAARRRTRRDSEPPHRRGALEAHFLNAAVRRNHADRPKAAPPREPRHPPQAAHRHDDQIRASRHDTPGHDPRPAAQGAAQGGQRGPGPQAADPTPSSNTPASQEPPPPAHRWKTSTCR